MNAYEIPNLRFSLPAGGEVARCRFVAVDANSNGVQATAASQVIGVSMNKTKAGEVLEIADGIVMVEAAGAITAGTAVSPDATGKATTGGDNIVGVAITAAAAAGELVAVKI